MRFLADESCDFAVVRELRARGHDVADVVNISPRADDRTVIDLARRESRIVLTEDKDFGRLVYAATAASGGVVLLRFPAAARTSLGPTVADTVERFGDRLSGAFTVVQPGRVRISRVPD